MSRLGDVSVNTRWLAAIAITAIIALEGSAARAAQPCSLYELIESKQKIKKGHDTVVQSSWNRIDVNRIDPRQIAKDAYVDKEPRWVRVKYHGRDGYFDAQMVAVYDGQRYLIGLRFGEQNANAFLTYDPKTIGHQVEDVLAYKPGYRVPARSVAVQPKYKSAPAPVRAMAEEQISSFLTRHAGGSNPATKPLIAATLLDGTVVFGQVGATKSSKLFTIDGKSFTVSDFHAVELHTADFPNYAVRVARDFEGKADRVVRVEMRDGRVYEGQIRGVNRMTTDGREDYRVDLDVHSVEEVDGKFRDVVETRRVRARDIFDFKERLPNEEAGGHVFPQHTHAQRKRLADFLGMRADEFQYMHDEAFNRLSALMERMDGIPAAKAAKIRDEMIEAAQKAAKGCLVR